MVLLCGFRGNNKCLIIHFVKYTSGAVTKQLKKICNLIQNFQLQSAAPLVPSEEMKHWQLAWFNVGLPEWKQVKGGDEALECLH